MSVSLGNIPMRSANGMSPQQIRLFHLQAARAWGNFTHAESLTLHSEAPSRRREATPVDLSPFIRWVPADANLNELKTIAMEGE